MDDREQGPVDGGKDDEVVTPGGRRPRSKVRAVPHGYHVSGEGGRLRLIETATGKVLEDLGEVSEADAEAPTTESTRPESEQTPDD